MNFMLAFIISNAEMRKVSDKTFSNLRSFNLRGSERAVSKVCNGKDRNMLDFKQNKKKQTKAELKNQ